MKFNFEILSVNNFVDKNDVDMNAVLMTVVLVIKKTYTLSMQCTIFWIEFHVNENGSCFVQQKHRETFSKTDDGPAHCAPQQAPVGQRIIQISCSFPTCEPKLIRARFKIKCAVPFSFCRYMPNQHRNYRTFPVAGVHIMEQTKYCNPSQCRVRLTNISREHSGGSYRCEVSSEAPAFRLAAETHNVTIAGRSFCPVLLKVTFVTCLPSNILKSRGHFFN